MEKIKFPKTEFKIKFQAERVVKMGVNTAEMLEKSIKKQILYKLLYEALKFENEGKELKDFILYIETMIDNE